MSYLFALQFKFFLFSKAPFETKFTVTVDPRNDHFKMLFPHIVIAGHVPTGISRVYWLILKPGVILSYHQTTSYSFTIYESA